MTGRCDSRCTIGMAEMSRVLRVACSNVRMPRSHSTMSRLPRCAMYSAAISHSSYVAAKPRLSSTGLPAAPTACSSGKFCMLRVPTCSMSAYRQTTSTSVWSTTSVTTGIPVWARTSARIRSPARPSPWNAYGDVRGLYAPPRSSVAPAALAISAAARVCSAVSTAHGPAISVNVSGPIGTLPTVTVEVAGWCSRLTSLYGAVIRTTSSTPGRVTTSSDSSTSSAPTTPTMVRVTPRDTNADPPAASTWLTTPARSASPAVAVITMTMSVSGYDEAPVPAGPGLPAAGTG